MITTLTRVHAHRDRHKNLSNVGTLKKEKGPSVSWKWRSEGPQTSKTSGNSVSGIPFLFFSWWRLRKFSAFSSRWRLGKFRAFFSMVAEKILCFFFSVLSQDTVDRKTLQRFAGKITLFSIAVPQLNFILAPCSVLSYLPSSPLISPLK